MSDKAQNVNKNGPFERFVQQIAAVPKEHADKIEAERPKALRRKRRLKAKK